MPAKGERKVREITYKSIIENDLMKLTKWRFAIIQLQSEIETLNAEYASIKATNYDKMPNGSGENYQEEKLVTVIAMKDKKEADLRLNKMRVADLERLLSQLPDDERLVLDRMVVNKEKYATDNLQEELGCESAQIYRIKNRALMHLAQLRHGAAYQP